MTGLWSGRGDHVVSVAVSCLDHRSGGQCPHLLDPSCPLVDHLPGHLSPPLAADTHNTCRRKRTTADDHRALSAAHQGAGRHHLVTSQTLTYGTPRWEASRRRRSHDHLPSCIARHPWLVPVTSSGAMTL